MTEKLIVSFSPHIRSGSKTNRIMIDVVIALTPALVASIVIFGPRAAILVAVCVFSCVLFEWGFQKYLKRPVTIMDFSAVITGLLIAFNLPVTLPLWMAVVGCFVAIVMVKQLFGGLGRNFANPAIVARVVLFIAFPIAMTTWNMPEFAPNLARLTDAVSSPTPLYYLLNQDTALRQPGAGLPLLSHMFFGLRGGSIGETSIIALLIGGAYLLIRGVIRWHIPVSFIGTVAVLTFISGGFSPYIMAMHVLAGGVVLGAVFMATDYVTSPQTKKGRIIFGIGCGVLTVAIRLFGNYPEGVSFAILFMNVLVPFINKYSMTKPLGGKKA